MSNIYHGYDMSFLPKYTINCKDCPKKVKVFQASSDSIPKPQSQNIGKYYYSCKQSNKNCNCSFFRWFEHKWPKVEDEYQDSVNEGTPSPIDNEMQDLIGQLKYIDIGELSTQDKIEINGLVIQLEQKINGSSISIINKETYLKTLSDLKKII